MSSSLVAEGEAQPGAGRALAGDPGPVPPLRPTHAVIDLDVVAHNTRELRKLAGGAELMTVVKADAYGHGICETAAVCLEHGATRLGVAILDEALRLRSAGCEAPVLVLGPLFAHQAASAVLRRVTATVSRPEEAEVLAGAARELGRKALAHVKVDTGMSRLGIFPDAAGAAAVERILSLPGLELEGIFTHFAAADEADKSHAEAQFDRFMSFLDLLRGRGIEFRLRHAANSAALLDMPQTYLDMVRPGILTVGVWPSDEVGRNADIRPAMTLRTAVGFIREVPAGSAVSYGCTYVTRSPAVLATLPLGYHDGYRRRLSNKAEVLVRGRRAPVRGRICMDQTIIDVGGIPGVSHGDEVIALGRQGDEEVTAEELARIVGTIGYEIVTTIGQRVPRVYVRHGRPFKLSSLLGEWPLDGWEDLPGGRANGALSGPAPAGRSCSCVEG